MAYNEELANRIREELAQIPGLVEKKMFGGVGFLIRGNMAVGVHKQDLIVRVGPERYEESLSRPHARLFDISGRPSVGWVLVAPDGYRVESDLKRWIQQGVEFAQSLPAK
ncbi:MAG: RNA methyltransferase [Chloroflexi bacterium RBG_19FT_COMBO_55_16]|nr:MAG: RNA methyltransferase [Chloroflexi bacterium RBG_19FT_COMBO_55_16]